MSTKRVKAEIERLILENKLNYCLECGKCSADCSMLDFYGEYDYDRSPRGVVERLSMDPEMIDDETLWFCLTCRQCTFFCPSGITYQDFVMALRDLLIEYGYRDHAQFCKDCGAYIMPKKEFEKLKKDSKGEAVGELLSVCPLCKSNAYRENLHKFSQK